MTTKNSEPTAASNRDSSEDVHLWFSEREFMILHWVMTQVPDHLLQYMTVETPHATWMEQIGKKELEVLAFKLDWAYDKITKGEEDVSE